MSGHAAEGAILKIRMMVRIVMVQVVRRDRRAGRRTEFQPERRPGGRHETDGDVGAEQQRGQHDKGRHAKLPAL